MIITTFLVGCSLKEAADNNWEAKTKITPLVPAQKLSERFGDTIIVKIPLAQSSLGYVDIDEVIAEIVGKEKLDRDSKNFFERLRDGFILSVGRLAIGSGFFNKFKVSSYNNFEYLDSELIKSVKVKRAFFSTENCRVGEQDCDNKGNVTTNFTFVDKLFVNISNYTDPEGTPENMLLANLEGDELEGVVMLSDEDFNGAANQSFTQTEKEIQQKIKTMSGEIGDIRVLEGDNNSVNLVKFTSPIPVMNVRFEGVLDSDRNLHLAIPEKQQRKAIVSYLKSDSFDKYIKNVKSYRDGIEVVLKKHVTPKMLGEKISNDQSPAISNMVIFRLNKNKELPIAKNYFKSSVFDGIVKDASIVGESVYVELADANVKTLFNMITGAEDGYKNTELDIYSVDSCIYANCVEVDGKDFNLVPIIAANPKVKIDTFFSIKTLGSVDFKYNGFIEVEVKLNLPL